MKKLSKKVETHVQNVNAKMYKSEKLHKNLQLQNEKNQKRKEIKNAKIVKMKKCKIVKYKHVKMWKM